MLSPYFSHKDGPAKVKILKIKSLISKPIILSVKSNLKNQCIIFADEALKIPASRVYLSPRSLLSLYVALQPKLPSEWYNLGECRDITGGIHIRGDLYYIYS